MVAVQVLTEQCCNVQFLSQVTAKGKKLELVLNADWLQQSRVIPSTPYQCQLTGAAKILAENWPSHPPSAPLFDHILTIKFRVNTNCCRQQTLTQEARECQPSSGWESNYFLDVTVINVLLYLPFQYPVSSSGVWSHVSDLLVGRISHRLVSSCPSRRQDLLAGRSRHRSRWLLGGGGQSAGRHKNRFSGQLGPSAHLQPPACNRWRGRRRRGLIVIW